jgi:uncharacterized protein
MYENDMRQTVLLPVTPGERIDAIDVLRGIAIFGVLLAFTLWNLGGPPASTLSTADTTINFILGLLLDSKAYTLLAFLFGVGFSIQLTRAEERGKSIVPAYCRRLLGMVMIGLVHALLLRNGDILVPYATMGFVLLLFRNASDKTLLAAALVGSIVQFVAFGLWQLSGIPFPARPETEGMGHLAANFLWVKYWYTTAITNWPSALPMFFFGLYIGRRRVLENITAYRRTLWRILFLGLVLGVTFYFGPMALAGSVPKGKLTGVFLSYAYRIHAWGFASFYAASVLLLLQRRFWQKLLSPFAPVGRMALTNYLLQATIIVPLCIVFDLYDKVTPSFGVLLGVLVFLFQVPFSVLWLRHFRFGPAEWLWRSITYWKPQPMRLTPSAIPQAQSVLSIVE